MLEFGQALTAAAAAWRSIEGLVRNDKHLAAAWLSHLDRDTTATLPDE